MSHTSRALLSFLTVLGLMGTTGQLASQVAHAQTTDKVVYLPLVLRDFSALARARIVNAPYFAVPEVMETATFAKMATIWHGAVTPSSNYTDVRIGYNDDELAIYAAVFDRLLWFDTTRNAATLSSWDSMTLYLDTGATPGNRPGVDAFRFDLQLAANGAPQLNAAYRGNGSQWVSATIDWRATSSYRGDHPPNSGGDSRGWLASFWIPFASLGLNKPAGGAVWRMALVTHDRDAATQSTAARSSWPEIIDGNVPDSWGRLRFGLPAYTAPAIAPAGTTTISHRLNGAVVLDANVGGSSICGGDPATFFSEWGSRPWSFYKGSTPGDFNIQNQSDLADWPCFAKYYVAFPLAQIPPGKVILSATLTLHQLGGSEPSLAEPSLIQVMNIGEAFDPATTTWNNAPLPMENTGRAWVGVLPGFAGFPGVARTWDVTYALAQAYDKSDALRMVLYSADSAYHSGKYFVSSQTGDWNAAGRPALTVVWGNP